MCDRAIKWAELRKKQVRDKKVCITVFSFPPDKGNVGTAAYLNVFGSIYKVLKGLQDEGYDVGALPETDKELMESVLNDTEARFNSEDLNVACKMSVPEYKLCLYQEALEENWGPARNPEHQRRGPPRVRKGVWKRLHRSPANLRVRGRSNEAPLLQVRALTTALPPTTFVEHVFKADAVLHFGPRLAGVHARKAGRHVRQGAADSSSGHPKPLLLRRQQP